LAFLSASADLEQLKPHAAADFINSLRPWYSTTTSRFDIDQYLADRNAAAA